jgi:DNA-directed RNA polymerase beta' subunit
MKESCNISPYDDTILKSKRVEVSGNFSMQKNRENQIFLERVNRNYSPGCCQCGYTSTEVSWGASIFCDYCGTNVSSEVLPRRYRLGYLPLSLPVGHIWYLHYDPRPLPRLSGFSRRLFPLLLRCEIFVPEELTLTLNQQDQQYFSLEFRPIQRLINLSGIATAKLLPRNQFLRKITFTSFGISFDRTLPKAKKKQINTSEAFLEKDFVSSQISNVCSIIIPQAKVFRFPWYCLYRDIPFFSLQKEEKKIYIRRNVENLEDFKRLLISDPIYPDQFLIFCQKIKERNKSQKTILVETNLRIRIQCRWLSQEPSRTGGELFLNRLQILHQRNWCCQARFRIQFLKKNIENFEEQVSLDKVESLKYRRLIQTRNQILTRLRILIEIDWANIRPHWIILQCLPILPPDLRPILSLGGIKVMVADVNTLYQRVVERNNRVAQIRRLVNLHRYYSTRELRYHERLLQESLENLFNGSSKAKKGESDSKQRTYKALSEILKGKRGRFRYNLLGKRVDYSGRSVIVSGPSINIYQCGLPRTIILTLFQPFLIRFLVGRIQKNQKIRTRFQARHFLNQHTDKRWNKIGQVLLGIPVLLNRAPTLHRFGFQAFQPQIIRGCAIQLHPLACRGFNADFDGDQIAIHVPLSPQARAEAWRLISPGVHFFSPATGEPEFRPSQDIVLGTYYITTKYPIFSISTFSHNHQDFLVGQKHSKVSKIVYVPLVFLQADEVFQAFESGRLKLHQVIWLCVINVVNLDFDREVFSYEMRVGVSGRDQSFSLWNWEHKKSIFQILRTTVGRVIFSLSLNL